MFQNSSFIRSFAYSFIGLFVYWVICLFPPVANGAVMSGDYYSIDQQDVQIQPFVREEPKQKNETIKHYAEGTNYVVETTTPEAFSFSSSAKHISFGTLQPTNPVLRTLTFLLTSVYGYQILTIEDHPLRIKPEIIIPDTSCDNGSCSPITEAPWTSTLTYGFGYRIDTMEPSSFKPFPNLLRSQPLSSLLHEAGTNNHEVTVTYKTNISGTQASGSYSNTVTYIATPDF